MQNYRNNQQSRSSAIIQIQHKVPGQVKQSTSKASQPQKSSHEVIRHLVQDLDRYKDENEELQASLAQITRSYLLEKAQVEELTAHILTLNQGPGQQQRNVDKMVEKQMAVSQKETVRIIENQNKTIEKYRKYKLCLSKNVYDLQERLKATRQELQQTQKQLFSLQQGPPVSPTRLNPNKSASLGSENGSNTGKKSNKIMHMDFDQNEVETHEKPSDPSIPGRQARYLTGNKAQGGVKTSKATRNGMQVAKSLALNLGEQKYDWLFNDDETPRELPENILSERDSARYPTINTGKKLVLTGHKGIPQSDRSDQLTMTSTNNKSLINQKMKQTPHVLNNNFEQLSQTIDSNRGLADESMMIFDRQEAKGINDQGNGGSHSIVKKSLNNVKSIIKKAKDGLRASGQAENIGEIEKKFYTNPFEVNHEQVQIELASSQVAYGQNWPNGQSHGKFSAYEPQKANQSLINEFGDQNPLDDDSN